MYEASPVCTVEVRLVGAWAFVPSFLCAARGFELFVAITQGVAQWNERSVPFGRVELYRARVFRLFFERDAFVEPLSVFRSGVGPSRGWIALERCAPVRRG